MLPWAAAIEHQSVWCLLLLPTHPSRPPNAGAISAHPLLSDPVAHRIPPLPCLSPSPPAGPSLLVAPVLDEGATAVQVVLPGGGLWYDNLDGTTLDAAQAPNRNFSAPVTLEHIRSYLRGGTMLTLKERARRSTAQVGWVGSGLWALGLRGPAETAFTLRHPLLPSSAACLCLLPTAIAYPLPLPPACLPADGVRPSDAGHRPGPPGRRHRRPVRGRRAQLRVPGGCWVGGCWACCARCACCV